MSCASGLSAANSETRTISVTKRRIFLSAQIDESLPDGVDLLEQELFTEIDETGFAANNFFNVFGEKGAGEQVGGYPVAAQPVPLHFLELT
jgi:hypothetical protein